jgi:hypothetical protein
MGFVAREPGVHGVRGAVSAHHGCHKTCGTSRPVLQG